MFLQRYGTNNQAGDLKPHDGVDSRKWRRGMGFFFVHAVTVQGRHGFNDFVGAIRLPGVVPRAVRPLTSGYFGDTPADVQPVVYRLPPWGGSE